MRVCVSGYLYKEKLLGIRITRFSSSIDPAAAYLHGFVGWKPATRERMNPVGVFWKFNSHLCRKNS